MKMLFLVPIILGAAGCATYSERQQDEARLSYSTPKSQETYLRCIAPKFIDINGMSTSVQDGENWVVTLPGGGNVMHGTVTIIAEGEGSRVEYRQLHNLEWGAFGRARQAVADCL